MSTPLEQAKELHKKFKESGSIEAQQKLADFMSEYDGDDAVVESDSLIEEIKAFEDEERYYTGLKKLDDILDGFRSNQLVAISAPTKAGKTQFVVHLAKHLPNPTMFLFEETAPEVLWKYHKKGLELPNFYTPKNERGMTLEDVYRKMIEAWAKYDSRIFFIDHLHYLLDDGKEQTTYKIKKVVQELKEFARMHKFTIFLVAHIKHQSINEPPGIEAIRDSSFVAQYADTTLMLWRETYQSGAREHKNLYNYTNNLLVNVALNRKINFQTDNNTGLADFTFNTDTWSYEESEWYTEWIEDQKREDGSVEDIYKKLKK